MIIIDTSAWVRFFRGLKDAAFVSDRIQDSTAVLHPLVLGELLLGGLSAQNETLLRALSSLPTHPPERICQFIKDNSLAGKGIGWVDAAILCSAMEAGAALATFDEALLSCGRSLGLICRVG